MSNIGSNQKGLSPLGRMLGLALALLFMVSTASGQAGHVLNGVGPVDQGMAGAGMAIPQDVLSMLHWNPGAITSVTGTEIGVSLQLMMPTGTIASSVNQNAFGPMFGPPQNLSGSTDSDAGPFPIPALGVVHASEASPWAFGFSAFGVGGFGVDYAMATDFGGNPVLLPQPPNGLGFGAISSEFALLQASPTVAYRVSDKLSIGVAPTFNYATLKVTPFPAAQPDDANGDGFPSYPGAPKDVTYGFGIQAGVQVDDPSGFHFAASFKSTQNFSDFEFESADETGADRMLTFDLDYPMVVSAGIGYTGIEGLALALDARYIDFENTNGFKESGFNQFGAVQGFGWKSITVLAIGLQYEVVEGLPVRLGYSYNDNPVEDDMTFFNTPAPAIIQHHLAGGFSYAVTEKVRVAVAAQYGLKNDVTGTWKNPGFITSDNPLGSAPGTSVTSELSTLTAIFGVTIGL